jgi:hypothetical protein
VDHHVGDGPKQLEDGRQGALMQAQRQPSHIQRVGHDAAAAAAGAAAAGAVARLPSTGGGRSTVAAFVWRRCCCCCCRVALDKYVRDEGRGSMQPQAQRTVALRGLFVLLLLLLLLLLLH